MGIFYIALTYYGSALLAVNLLGPAQYGLFSLAFMVPNLLISFLVLGLDVTAVRHIAHNLGKKNEEKALKCAQTIFLVRVIVTVLSTIALFLLSGPIARLLGEDITLGLQLLSLYVGVYLVARYLLCVLTGYFKIKERTIAEILWNTLNLILLIPLVYLGFGYLSPILSFLAAFTFAIVLSVYYLEKAHIPAFRIQFEGITELKEYLRYSFYVYLSDSFYMTYIWVGTIVIELYSMPIETVGYYRAMFAITNAVLIVSYAFTIVLFPMLSELNARKEIARLSFSLQKVISYMLAVSIPAALGMFLLSEHFVAVLFPKYLPAADLLRIFSFRIIFLPLWAVLATALLTLDREKKQALLAFGLCSLSFVLSLAFGIFGVEGITLASTIALAIVVVAQYVILKRQFPQVNAGPVRRFCFSALVMCGCVWVILQINMGDALKVLFSLCCGIAVYVFLILKTGAVSKVDFDIMRSALSAFGRFGKGLEPVLDLAQKIQEW